GTSNWSGDYFYNTTGVAVVVDQSGQKRKPLVEQLRRIFVRDWDSSYAHRLPEYMSVCLENQAGDPMCAAEKTH
ncbi:unnamed protein product, partial [Soboliphyme baturini]|uniref:Phospholipase D family, member 5 n=1 Tax=Soboliphyme baturini TaxID=241478 RepID=A0A183JAM4_9BILA